MGASPHFSHSMLPAPVEEADRAEAARRAMWVIGQVSRFRSSHNIAAGADANFGTKGTLAISILLVPLLNPKFAIDSRQRWANFGFGALAQRHTLSASSTGPSGCLSAGISSARRLNRMARYAFAARRRICHAERATQAAWSVRNAG